MPIIKSAKKRVKQAAVRQARNYQVRVGMRKAIRLVNDEVKAGNQAEAEKGLTAAYKVIDTAVKKNIMHKNTAARRKSSLAKSITSINDSSKAVAPANKKKAVTKKA